VSVEEFLTKEAREDLISIHINEFSTETFRETQEDFLRAECSGQTVVPVYINSGGGDLNVLFAMIDLIKSSKLPVATVALGEAMSCGADLLAAGTKGYRYASPFSAIMVHEGLSGYVGTPSSVQTHAKYDLQQFSAAFDLLDAHCGQVSGYWIRILKEAGNPDYFMTAEEAQSHGLCDFVRLPRFEPEIIIKTKIV